MVNRTIFTPEAPSVHHALRKRCHVVQPPTHSITLQRHLILPVNITDQANIVTLDPRPSPELSVGTFISRSSKEEREVAATSNREDLDAVERSDTGGFGGVSGEERSEGEGRVKGWRNVGM